MDVPAAAVNVRSACAGGTESHCGAARMAVSIPVRTVSALNFREHWRARAARVKKERAVTAWVLAGKPRPALPCAVLLVRVGPSNGLDDDNLRGASKGVRDEIAKWLGVDDRDPLVTWAYDQRRGKEWAVEVEIA